MTRTRDDERLSARDAELVERMRNDFAPAPLDSARAAAFDARLHERLARPRRRPLALAALATATATALAWALLPGVGEPGSASEADAFAAAAWEQEVIFGEGLEDPFGGDEEVLLPPEYEALASAFEF